MMTFILGGFIFRADQVGSMQFETDYNISESKRIRNYDTFFATTKESETLNLTGQTLPYYKDTNRALNELYELASLQEPLPLINANGKYYGNFIIKKIGEERTVFSPEGGFFYQTFNIEMVRDYG
ncbi:phage tail protein [Campylobacter sputorum]|uniref:phage tail protein n=2 Tax=Campylobacter sputorum TaxID=206 RepID=UPI001E4D62E6|nr:phage tail protein [Campylobacter sputorum]